MTIFLACCPACGVFLPQVGEPRTAGTIAHHVRRCPRIPRRMRLSLRLRDHRTAFVAAALALLGLNAWVQNGTSVFLVLIAAAIGCVVAVAVPGVTSFHLVSKDADAAGPAVASAARREVAAAEQDRLEEQQAEKEVSR